MERESKDKWNTEAALESLARQNTCIWQNGYESSFGNLQNEFADGKETKLTRFNEDN